MASLDLAALFFGAFVSIFVFAVAKACKQTFIIWNHKRSLNNTYVFLVWGEAVCNLVFAVTTILFLTGVIPSTDAYFAAACILWAIQVELLPQIIANRVSLIMVDRKKAKQLKWGLAALITPVCCAVLYIWTVAHIQGATPSQIELNRMFEIIEKCFFLIIDLTLNLYFLYLVRYRLIGYGLSKYWTLFKFNIGMVFISTAFDATLLGFLQLPDPYVYVQFAPLAYISKLWIELQMANLIFKVVCSGTKQSGHSGGEYYYSSRSGCEKGQDKSILRSQNDNVVMRSMSVGDATSRENGSEVELRIYPGEQAITKTIETTVVVDDIGEGGQFNNAARQHW